MTTIIAANQTAGALSLTKLSAPNQQIPASGSVTLTDFNFVWEIVEDTELDGYINSDDVLLDVDGTLLTKAQSLALMGGGEKNTVTEVGTGTGFFKQKVGADLEFKTLLTGATSRLTVTPAANEVTLNVIGGETFTVYDGSGGQALGGGLVDLTFDTILTNTGTVFNWVGPSELEFNTAGKVYLNAKLCVVQTAGGRTVSACRVQYRPNAGGYGTVNGSIGFAYTRNNTDGNYGSTEVSFSYVVGAGDRFKIEGIRISGAGTVVKQANGSNFNCVWIPL
jgi:hypothetical protein